MDFIKVVHGARLIGAEETTTLLININTYKKARERYNKKYGKNAPGFLKWYSKLSFEQSMRIQDE